jgi:hypothetical protein
VLALKIIRIEAARHRLGLSLRQVDEDAYAGGTYTTGPVDATEDDRASNASAPSEYDDAGVAPADEGAPPAAQPANGEAARPATVAES